MYLFSPELAPRSCSHPMGHTSVAWPYITDNQGTISHLCIGALIENIGRGSVVGRRPGASVRCSFHALLGIPSLSHPPWLPPPLSVTPSWTPAVHLLHALQHPPPVFFLHGLPFSVCPHFKDWLLPTLAIKLSFMNPPLPHQLPLGVNSCSPFLSVSCDNGSSQADGSSLLLNSPTTLFTFSNHYCTFQL